MHTMKKFIAAFDGLSFKEPTLTYAIYLAKQCDAQLVGVFLEDYTRHSYSYRQLASYEGEDKEAFLHVLDERDEEQRTESIEKFQQACVMSGVNYAVHRDRNVALQELLAESIYADLLILSAAETLTRFTEDIPSFFIRDLLTEVQCPVFLVPDEYRLFERIILLYDGEPSSVYAARTFSYLFGSFNEVETIVLTVRPGQEATHLPNSRLIKEFVRRHFPKAEYIVMKGDAEGEIVHYLQQEKKSSLIVLGAYQRSRLSRMFRPSMADRLLRSVKAPLFIAHNKS